MRNNTDVACALLAGVVIGAAVGMLFAPHKGKVTRRIILHKGQDIAEDVTETVQEAIGKLTETFNEKIDGIKKEIRSKLS